MMHIYRHTSYALPILLLLCLFWTAPLLAQSYTREQYLSLIESYVARTVNIYDGNWAYSYTVHDRLDAESVTRRIDPSKPFLQSDQLVAINSQAPSAERRDQHERRMQRRLRRRENADRRSLVDEEREREGSEKERFLNLIIRDSVRLVKQEGDLHTLEFRGMEEDRRAIYEHLTGLLVLDTRNEYIRELQIRVHEPFSPYFIMRINSGYFSLRFELVDGVPMQSDATWQLDGHVLFVRDLDRDQEVEWFDVEYTGSEPAS